QAAELIVLALTCGGIPEMIRGAGLTPVPADVDPRTFNLEPSAFERAISERTVAVVPTHLYGLPCDMASIVGLARRHGLAVIEDCAHALGAKYRGRSVGTFGDAAFFSLDVRQPLNTYGGGIAVARDAAVLARVRQQAEAEPWPGDTRVRGRLRAGTAQRLFSRPWVFTLTRYPALLAGTLGQARPNGSRGETIRPLDPLPAEYHERY